MNRAGKPSTLSFRLMALEFRLRDWLRPPLRVLVEADLHPGMTVLDFGCAPGSFTVAAARIVGPAGRICALDISPLASKTASHAARRSHPERP